MSAVRLGLAWAGEYSLLSLIEDAPEVLKVATILCSLAALACLEGRIWLNRQRAGLFTIVITVIIITYGAFIAYATAHTYIRYQVNEHLQHIYADGAAIRQAPLSQGTVNVPRWTEEVTIWRDDTAAYINDNIGVMAYRKFLNTGAKPSIDYSRDQSVNHSMNLMNELLDNLEAVIYANGYSK
jgi:hypothetical protein